MVATTRRGSKYQRYLASREWAVLKEQIRERCDGRCENCLVGKYESTHHLTYERIYHEQLSDLLAVCDECHEWFSGKRDENPLSESWVISDSQLTEKGRAFHFVYCIIFEDELPPLYQTGNHVFATPCEFECRWCRARHAPLSELSECVS